MRRKVSKMWGYFTRHEKRKAECNICKTVLSISGGSISNLKRHLRMKHGFSQELNESNDTTECNLDCLLHVVTNTDGEKIAEVVTDVQNVQNTEEILYCEVEGTNENGIKEQNSQEIEIHREIKKPKLSYSLNRVPQRSKVEVVHGVGTKDQYTVFGEEVGMRIRDLPSSYARKIVKHLISTTLFEAEMGKYDDPNSYTIQSPFLPTVSQNVTNN